ncbi:MAG: DUF4405 domain-containing protein [Methanomicrobiales archaeon]|nr:DUF4405 domain-containing protein [Methanomicrobiales archaeon]
MDIGLGIVFLFSAITGLLKYMVLLQVPVISSAVIPMAWMSDIHDRAGIFVVILVGLHLFLNRGWLITMTRKILAGAADTP